MQAFARGVIRHVLEGPDGAKLKASIQDENPQDTAVQVNGRYPDTVPLSTMPPDILAALRSARDDQELTPNGWPTRYAARRIAWHVLDHAWEIEDRSE
jgi:hypothetical protein